MKKKSYSGYIIAGIVLLLGIYIIVTFNALVEKEEQVKLKWGEVQSTYQRRSDLVPNLVNVVKGGAIYEQTTLQQVTEARARAASVNVSGDITAEKFNQQGAVQDQLASAANRLLISVEKYPDIKGTRAFSDLQVQLEGTERRIKVARKDFNSSVAVYNSSVRGFPTRIVAGLLGFTPKDGFNSDAGADHATEIKF